jgi:hypothetical protein
MKWELTQKEQHVIAFFLCLLFCGSLIYVVRHHILIEAMP